MSKSKKPSKYYTIPNDKHKCQSEICKQMRSVIIPGSTMSNIYRYRVNCISCDTFQPRNPEVDSEGKAQYCKCCGKKCRLGPKQGAKGKEKYRQRRFKVLLQQTIEDISCDDTVVWMVNKPLLLLQERMIVNG